MAHDIDKLAQKLQALGKSVVDLAAAKHAEKMLFIIHKPGYTSPVEHAFMNAMVDTLQHHVTGLHQTLDDLYSVGDMIGKE